MNYITRMIKMTNPKLKPWIVPRWSIDSFCNMGFNDHFFVSQILEHDARNYLVITLGEDIEIAEELSTHINRMLNGY